ncbi:MAG: hypothetical protein HY347_12360 [candidate division NC10 bacterium]|nr:hypothetical protein [candidate division NC10 bacterium]
MKPAPPGPLVEIVPAADPVSRTFTAKIALPALPGLRSGLFGKALFVAGQRQGMVVPRQAVVERGQLVGVFVLEEGKIARLRLVKMGKTFGDRVEILSGLAAGERIVVEGAQGLSDGSPVEVRG